MKKPKETSRPPVREGGLDDNKARLAASLGTGTTAGQGFDRGGWEPISVPKVASRAQETAPLRPPTLAKERPSDPFDAEPLAADEMGGWSGANNPRLEIEREFDQDDQAAAAK